MKILVTSIKGGVGKSSIATNLAVHIDAVCVTNDLITKHSHWIHQIVTKTKRIPKEYCNIDNVVFDFGAMSTNIDPKISHAIDLCDVIVIPTFTDERSLHAALETYNLVITRNKPVVFIINNFTKRAKYLEAENFLTETIPSPLICAIRTTTLFDRVVRQGQEWFLDIKHAKGEYQLNKTQLMHEIVYDTIMQEGVRH